MKFQIFKILPFFLRISPPTSKFFCLLYIWYKIQKVLDTDSFPFDTDQHCSRAPANYR